MLAAPQISFSALEQLERRYYLSATTGSLASYVGSASIVSGEFASAAAPNQAITDDGDVQQMPSVAVDPLDSNHVVITYMDYSLVESGYAGIGVAVSHDAGDTWQYSSIPLPDGFKQGAANPTVRFDSVDHDSSQEGVQNRVYVSFMAATFAPGRIPPLTNPNQADGAGVDFRAYGFMADNGIFVAASGDGGLTWNPEDVRAVSSHLYNGANKVPFEIIPDLAIDTFKTLPNGNPNPLYGSLYVTYSRYYPAGQYPGEPESTGGSNIIFSVSLDGGRTWQEKTESQPEEGTDHATVIFNENLIFSGTGPVEGQGYENWAHVTVGPEGTIYVSQFTGGQFVVHRSTDGGQSFIHPNLDDQNSALSPFGVNTPIHPPPFLSTNAFRLQNVRAIAADPTRPGSLYVAEADQTTDNNAEVQDEADVVFARSTNQGDDWQTTFQVGDNTSATFVNDDNGGVSATGSPNDVASFQFMPRLVAGADGNLALIWYDTRRDSVNHLIDVFAAVSTDGGQTFSQNFRVTDRSFDANAGKFKDARQRDNYYFGDTIGMALANNTMFAAWTDTRAGNQDIYFSRVSLNPIPDALNDRYEPNDLPDAATQIGPDPVFHSFVPQLTLAAGEDDWFKITPPLDQLTVTVQASNAANVLLELYDATGTTVLTTADSLQDTGSIIGKQFRNFRVQPNQDYLVRVHSLDDTGLTTGDIDYSLRFSAVTELLGEVVHKISEGEIQSGDHAYYLLQSKVAGTMKAVLTLAGDFQGTPEIEISDVRNPNVVLARNIPGSLSFIAPVLAGQQLLIRIVGGESVRGAYRLELTNLNQFDSALLEGPSEAAFGDLNGDDAPDIVVSHVGRNIVSVLLNNGDGTFQAPREFAVGAFQQGGPFTLFGVPNYHRDLAIADFNDDEIADLIAVNPSSGDVSLLLGNGDGTFQPQRRFDTTDASLANDINDNDFTSSPFALAIGDVNNDGNVDFVTVDTSYVSTAQVAVRLGRGDGTFQPAKFFTLLNREINRTNAIQLADVNNDGKLDLIERDFSHGTTVMLGNGDGTFQLDVEPIQPAGGPGMAVADLDHDGDLDVVTTRNNLGTVLYTLANGDGTFASTSVSNVAGQFPIAVAAADFGSAVKLADGSIVLGPADGHIDLIVADNGHTLPLVSGPAEVVLLPGLVDDQGNFAGFGGPIRLATPSGPLDVKVTNLNPDDDDALDVVVVDRDKIMVIYGQQPAILPNETLATARDLGFVVHVVEPTHTIVPEHKDAYYKLTVATEAFTGAREQVLDFSSGFANQDGAGLMMEVLNAAGAVLGSGDRFRIHAQQGDELFVHIFGKLDDQNVPGVGAYTLVINTLPQVATVEAHALLNDSAGRPGGPTTSLVLVMQGERLDPATAEAPENYTVTWLGPNGIEGGGDDQVIAVGSGLAADSPAVVYDPSRNNVDMTSDGQRLVFPNAVRQTVTLLFGNALPAGNYKIEVSSAVTSTPFNADELAFLSPRTGFNDHPVVSRTDLAIVEGATRVATVLPARNTFDTATFDTGFPFVIAFHGNAGALLDTLLSSDDDAATATQELVDLILASFAPGLVDAAGRPITSMLVIVLDPVSFNLIDPEGRSFAYDLKADVDNAVTNNLRGAFVEVSSNVEVIVIANPRDTYRLQVADVPARARGAAVYFGLTDRIPQLFTTALRQNTTSFTIVSPDPAPPVAFFSAASTSQSVFVSAPQFTSVFRSFVSAGNGSTPLLLVTRLTTSSALLLELAASDEFGSGGSQNPSDAVRSMLDEVFGQWDDLKRAFVNKPQVEDGDATETPFDTMRFGRAWQAVADAVESWFTPTEATTPAQQPAATQGANTREAAEDPDVGAPTNQSNVNANSDAQQAPEGAGSAQSDVDQQQPTAGNDSKAKDSAHATAA